MAESSGPGCVLRASLVTFGLMFLPAAWQLDRARERIVHSAPPEEVADRAPPGSFVAADLLRIAAMLAPILVGPVANFVNLKVGL